MWDDQHDKQMMRNQVRAIVVMTALLFAWWYFFMPEPPVQPPPGQQAAAPVSPGQTTGEPASLTATQSPGASPETPGPAFLPPVAEQDDFTRDEIVIEDEYLRLTFTQVGGRLKKASVLLGKDNINSLQLIPVEEDVPDADQFFPLGLLFTDEQVGFELDRRRWEAELDPSGHAVTFSIELPGHAEIRKRFALTDEAHVLNAHVEYINLTGGTMVRGMDVVPAYVLHWGPEMLVGDVADSFFKNEIIWRTQEGEAKFNETSAVEDLPHLDPANILDARIPRTEWIGYKTKYFLAAMRPEAGLADAYAMADGPDRFIFGVGAPRFEVAPGESVQQSYQVYVGPMELASLGAAWPTLDTSLVFFKTFGSMDWFAKFLLGILHWFYENTWANYGVAIILLTVVVRLVMLPLTLKSMQSMKRMQALAPEMKALQEEYKDDQQELSKRMMELYRTRGVNPLGGCFPMLLQMPIFIALYRMLWNAFELRGAEFIWVEDLSKPDQLIHLPFLRGLPLLGQYLEYFNLLPILMAGAMVLSMRLTPTTGPMQNPQQKMIMNLMPIIFAVFCYPLAAGLNLYVLTSTILGMGQQWLVRIMPSPETAPGPIKPDAKPKTDPKKKKRQHFYDRAQERRREMKKEERRQKVQKKKGKGKSGAKN